MKVFLKKIFRSIFGRLSIFGILFVLQVCLYLIVLQVFNDKFLIFQVISAIIAIVTLYSITSRDMPVESKMSWIIFILTNQLFGVILYIMFSKNKMSKKQTEYVVELKEKMKSESFGDIEEVSSKLDDSQITQMKYIYNCNRQKAYSNNDIKYYPFGEVFLEDYLRELNNAKSFIFMEYFIIEEGKMVDKILDILREKIKQGVEVRLIYDDIGTITKLPMGFAKNLRKEGFKAYRFNRFYPIVTTLFNNRDHRKITVIDGKVAFTGGVNLADEYCNYIHPFGVWKDNAIKITGSSVDGFTKMFLDNYNMNRSTFESYDKYLGLYENKVYPNSSVVIPYGDGPRPFYDEYVGENVYINMINNSKDYIWITTPYLICDSNLLSALTNASMRGVDVRVVLPHIPDKKAVFWVSRSNYKKLIKKGVKVYEYTPGFIHAKMFLSDDKTASVGTINLDYRSLIHHFENGTLIFGGSVINDIKNDFNDIFSKSQTMEHFKQNIFIKVFCKVVEIFQPLL